MVFWLLIEILVIQIMHNPNKAFQRLFALRFDEPWLLSSRIMLSSEVPDLIIFLIKGLDDMFKWLKLVSD